MLQGRAWSPTTGSILRSAPPKSRNGRSPPTIPTRQKRIASSSALTSSAPASATGLALDCLQTPERPFEQGIAGLLASAFQSLVAAGFLARELICEAAGADLGQHLGHALANARID